MNVPRFSLACAFGTAAVAAACAAAIAAPFGPRLVRPAVRVLSPASVHGSQIGAVAPGTTIDLYVRLAGRNQSQIDRLIAAQNDPGSPVYGRYLTPQQYGSYFGADPRDYARAVAMLRAAGFTIDAMEPNRTDIVAHAPASRVAAFFATPLDLRTERGRTFFTARYLPLMPPGFNAVAVSGLDDYVLFHSHMKRAAPHQVIGGNFSWSPQDLAVGYDLNPLYAKGLDGKGITIANATSGAATASDLAKFQKTFGLPPAQLVSTAVGGSLSPRGNGESTLDVDSATSVAREATFHQVVAHTASNHDFDLAYGYIVNTLGSTVHVVTTSWGTCERDMKGYSSLGIDEALFKQAATEGQWWFSASGDNGTDDCEDGGHAVSVDFPGSSPYVSSVGGTNVSASTSGGKVTAWTGETTWQYSNSNGASGGGKSILYTKPSYQAALTPHDGMRDVPDVSLLADDVNDGLWVVQGGGLYCCNGGTSEAAPQWAGLMAIIEQRKGRGAFVEPHARLYALAATSRYHSLFHDIVKGWNGVPGSASDPYGTFPGYYAGAGFDLTTGLGSYVGAALATAY